MAITVDRSLELIGNRFLLATIISRRWEQLIGGGRPMVRTNDVRSMQTVFHEIEEEKLKLNRDGDLMTIERHGEPIEPIVPVEGVEEDDLIVAVRALATHKEEEE
jgi:DNA-directed RNA polymerase subunit K/omega